MKKQFKPQIEYIEWEDASANSGWFTEAETKEWMQEAHLIGEVGWILRDDEKYIGFAARQDLTNEKKIGAYSKWGNIQIIPKTWIRKRKKLSI